MYSTVKVISLVKKQEKLQFRVFFYSFLILLKKLDIFVNFKRIINCLVYTVYTYIYYRENFEKKNKEHLRNLEAENSPKLKKRPGWPKNLV